MRSCGRLVLVILLLLQCGHQLLLVEGSSRPLVPAFFIFGDSLVDVGNNNYLFTLAKANLVPYGMDTPWGATGRFTNGKTVLDVVCDLIGLPYVPPYLDPNTKNARILKGVNYASGAGGILDDSGRNYIQRIPMTQQLNYFKKTQSSLVAQLGNAGAQQLMTESLFAVVMGNNDYINNYLLAGSQTRTRYTPEQYQNIVLTTYTQQLTELYNLGARRIVVASMGPLGCIPSQLAAESNNNGTCVESVNKIMVDFNMGLQQVLTGLNSQLPGATFVYADTYTPVLNIVSNPSAYGMKTVNQGCCGAGKFNGQVPCFLRFLTTVCSNRGDYLFFDPFHPTHAANIILGNNLYRSVRAAFGV